MRQLPLNRDRLFIMIGMVICTGCQSGPRPGTLAPRTGDEIIVAGHFFHTGTRVVTWMDPGGYDAYRVERRFSPLSDAGWEASKADNPVLATPERYNLRREGLSERELERLRGGGWDLPTLQKVVDQLVVHYDGSGTSRQCFKVLQDVRGLSIHFMLDLDGTIYQTLDVKERAWHAGNANSRSVGIEIANVGAYGPDERNPFDEWYAKDARGLTRLTIPERLGDGGMHTRNFVGRPARPDPVRGVIQGKELVQYDFTPQQYDALIKLTATLCAALPRIQCEFPHEVSGQPVLRKLADDEIRGFHGILGHYHLQADKVDPGPAFQWEHVIKGAQQLLRAQPQRNVERGAELLSR